MSVNFNFTCPQCSKTIQLPTAVLGKRGKCPSCGTAVLIQNQVAPLSETPPTMPPARGNVGIAPLNPLGSAPSYADMSPGEVRPQNNTMQLFRQQPFPGSLFSFSIEVVRDKIAVQSITDSADFSRVISNLLLAINMVLILVAGVAVFGFTGNYTLLIVALPAAFTLVLLSYVNNRSLEGIRTIVNDEFTISTTAFFDIVSAFFIAVLYLGPFLLSLAIYFQQWYLVLGLFGLCILAFYCAVVTINPGSLGFKQAQNATTADDALGLLAYIVKIGSSAVPYVYLLANIACIITFIYALFGPFFEEPFIDWARFPDGQVKLNPDGERFEIEVGAYTRHYIWLEKLKMVAPTIYFLAIPFVVYLASLISLASIYVLKAIVDSARHLKNIQRW